MRETQVIVPGSDNPFHRTWNSTIPGWLDSGQDPLVVLLISMPGAIAGAISTIG
jgi:hypothetical protein